MHQEFYSVYEIDFLILDSQLRCHKFKVIYIINDYVNSSDHYVFKAPTTHGRLLCNTCVNY